MNGLIPLFLGAVVASCIPGVVRDVRCWRDARRQKAAEHRLWVLIDIDPPAAELTDAELAAAEWAHGVLVSLREIEALRFYDEESWVHS